MISLQTKNAILTLYKRGFSKSKIARDLGINRQTVIKYIREDEQLNRELLEQEAGSVEQHRIMEKIAGKPEYKGKYQKRKRSKYTPEIEQEIERILADEKRKDQTCGKGHKLRCTVKDIHQALQEKGYEISYSTLTKHMRERRIEKLDKEAVNIKKQI